MNELENDGLLLFGLYCDAGIFLQAFSDYWPLHTSSKGYAAIKLGPLATLFVVDTHKGVLRMTTAQYMKQVRSAPVQTIRLKGRQENAKQKHLQTEHCIAYLALFSVPSAYVISYIMATTGFLESKVQCLSGESSGLTWTASAAKDVPCRCILMTTDTACTCATACSSP